MPLSIDTSYLSELFVKVVGTVAIVRQLVLSVGEVWAIVGKVKKPKDTITNTRDLR